MGSYSDHVCGRRVLYTIMVLGQALYYSPCTIYMYYSADSTSFHDIILTITKGNIIQSVIMQAQTFLYIIIMNSYFNSHRLKYSSSNLTNSKVLLLL